MRKDVPQLRGYILQRPEQMLYTGSKVEGADVRTSGERVRASDGDPLLGRPALT